MNLNEISTDLQLLLPYQIIGGVVHSEHAT